MEQHSFRTFLQNEYLRRRDKNPGYSLRAFARHLKIDPGSLSQFLNGRRPYSAKKIHQISFALGVDKETLAKFLDGHDKNGRLALVEFDRLDLLSKWYYPAIIETLSLSDFQPSPAWIADQLDLSVSVVNVALNQLFAAGVLTLKEDGSWQNNWPRYTTQKTESVDEPPLRELQKQFLERAGLSIDKNHAEEKSHTAYLTTLDKKLIPEIKNEIKIFRRRMADLIDRKSVQKNAIYCLQINFFPETQKTGEPNVENNEN